MTGFKPQIIKNLEQDAQAGKLKAIKSNGETIIFKSVDEWFNFKGYLCANCDALHDGWVDCA